MRHQLLLNILLILPLCHAQDITGFRSKSTGAEDVDVYDEDVDEYTSDEDVELQEFIKGLEASEEAGEPNAMPGHAVKNIYPVKRYHPVKGHSPVKKVHPLKNLSPVKKIHPVKEVINVKKISPIKSITNIDDDLALKMLREIEGDAGAPEIKKVRKVSTRMHREEKVDDCSELRWQAARLMEMFGVDSLDQIEQVTPYEEATPVSEEVALYNSEEDSMEPYKRYDEDVNVDVNQDTEEYDGILAEEQADIEKEAEMEKAIEDMMAKEKEKIHHLKNLQNKHQNALDTKLSEIENIEIKRDSMTKMDDLIPVEKVDKLEKINKMSQLEKVVPIKSMKKIIRMHELTEEQAHKLRRWQMERNGPRRVRTF